MSYNEKTIVQQPVTKESLIQEFEKLGIRSGQIIEVHASLSSFDYVIGGAQTVVDALMESVGSNGTIVMPTQNRGNTEPSEWEAPAIQPGNYREVRNAIPVNDPKHSDIYGMGSIVENFRHRPDVIISDHPSVSYCAWGRYAKLLCNRQSLHFPLAQESPAARMYEMKGYVLLIGCDFGKVTSMHLAEYRTDDRPIKINGCCVDEGNGPVWKSYLDLDIDSSVFGKVRPELIRKNALRETMFGGSRIQFFPLVYAVDEATKYFEQNSVYELYR